MSELGVEYSSLLAGADDWTTLARLMTDTSRDLDGQAPTGLAPSVQGAARAFLQAWSGYAQESEAIATGFADALRTAASDYGSTDRGAGDDYAALDSRLGPAR